MDDDDKPSDSSFLYGSEEENSILSEFGWDFSAETRSVTELDQIQGTNSAATYLYPETRSSSSSNSNHMILSDPLPPTPSNPSFSSTSSDDLAEKSTGSVEKPPDKPSKARKKGQKRTRQPRFAFITKTDVDHLEDGYRWRKYGQKAVKNSPYPRSYYRCTNSKCTVKKRVERSSEDPSTVITTYEGQHCHHTVSFPRGGIFSHDAAFMGRLNSSVSQMYVPGVQYPIGSSLGLRQSQSQSQAQQLQHEGSTQIHPEPTSQLPSDEGLLGDIVPAGMRNR